MLCEGLPLDSGRSMIGAGAEREQSALETGELDDELFRRAVALG